MYVKLPGSRRLHCCSNDLRSSAGLAWEVFGTMAILEMVTHCLHDWGSAREDTIGTFVMALCCRTTQLASTNFGFWTYTAYGLASIALLSVLLRAKPVLNRLFCCSGVRSKTQS